MCARLGSCGETWRASALGNGFSQRAQDSLPRGRKGTGGSLSAVLLRTDLRSALLSPGTIALEPALLLEVLLAVLDEIGRNGFKKIVLYNAHGGNTYLVRFLAQCTLWSERPYRLYVPLDRLTPERRKIWQRTCQTTEHGHACECETSITLVNYPELVRMDKVPSGGKAGTAQKRLRHLPPTFCGISWYADYPEHYAGDARSASVEKGRILRGLIVDSLAEYIAAVKTDAVVPALEGEFFERVAALKDHHANHGWRARARRKA